MSPPIIRSSLHPFLLSQTIDGGPLTTGFTSLPATSTDPGLSTTTTAAMPLTAPTTTRTLTTPTGSTSTRIYTGPTWESILDISGDSKLAGAAAKPNTDSNGAGDRERTCTSYCHCWCWRHPWWRCASSSLFGQVIGVEFASWALVI